MVSHFGNVEQNEAIITACFSVSRVMVKVNCDFGLPQRLLEVSPYFQKQLKRNNLSSYEKTTTDSNGSTSSA